MLLRKYIVNILQITDVQENIEMRPSPSVNADKPLVSVLVFNYNYGRWLRQCFDSIIAQTYPNIEICFSDNASSDDSWEIALEYSRKHSGLMTIARNRRNLGSDANLGNCLSASTGKYIIELCSDDFLEPEYVSRCVYALETNPKAAFAIVHRSTINENGMIATEPPFYNGAYLISGVEQAAVYMMAAVNPCISQVMYNKDMTSGKRVTGSLGSRWYGTRIMDFNMCMEHAMIYISEPLLVQRMHSQNDTVHATENMLEIIAPYVLQHQYADIASRYDGMNKVIDRLPQALEKLGLLCVRYCIRSLIEKKERCALRYFHLGLAISPEQADDASFKKLQDYWNADSVGKERILDELRATANLATRSVSYDPPPGSIPLNLKALR